MCWGPLLKLTMALRIGVCSWASFCPIQSAVVSHGISIHLAALCSVVSFLIIDVNAASLSWQIHEGFCHCVLNHMLLTVFIICTIYFRFISTFCLSCLVMGNGRRAWKIFFFFLLILLNISALFVALGLCNPQFCLLVLFVDHPRLIDK